ncbi:hypothetical protein [Nonomuraea maritima]|uniref:hypothetical protein n=1 Tax=Nonomuraea maritima TaxID=683260 RepID=UPI000B85EA03|nr:hypothetical protein [Nonomuraea maritima]
MTEPSPQPSAQPRTSAPASVGEIEGLRPRRRPGDGGDVSAADVDLIDGLAPAAAKAVRAWLLERSSAAARQTRLQVLAAFLRWLRASESSLDPLAATGAHLDAYCDAALTGTLTVGVRRPGRPLSDTTVNRRRAVLSSFYAHAWRTGAVSHAVHAGSAGGPLTREERRLLRRGVARLAADGRTPEAVAVALLEATGASVTALAELTARDLRGYAGGGPAVVTVRDGNGHPVAFPVPAPVRPLLRELSDTRMPGEPLIGPGRPADARWLAAALVAAAVAGGVPRPRAEVLHPGVLRATTVTELLEPLRRDAGDLTF